MKDPCSCGNSLAMYVWEGEEFLVGRKDSMICCLSCCETEAWTLVEDKDDELAWLIKNDGRSTPRRVDKPEAVVCLGEQCW